MSCEYGKDSTLNAELLHPRAQLVKCCACSLLRWGLQMYLSVLNIRSSSTDPGTNTITNSATFTHSPNLSRAPKRVALLQQRLEHACKLGEQLGVICLCCALNCCVVCTLVQLPLPAYQGFFNYAAALSLWLLLISWHAMFCFLHWKVAGQMLQ